MDHLENLRNAIEESPFRLRTKADRRSAPRGADRRSSTARKKTARRKKKAALSKGNLQVTVSIGVAEPSDTQTQIAHVLELADQALYAAKRGGRNRVEIASANQIYPPKRLPRTSLKRDT